MRERPIIFSAPMVRALLEGRKTQTRRAMKLPHQNPLGAWEATTSGGTDAHGAVHVERPALWHTRTGDMLVCPYGVRGDRLWVKETWGPCDGGFCYRADQPHDSPAKPDDGRWHPSIHMFRAASRIDLEVVGVRVEQLLRITTADVYAEGAVVGARADQSSGFAVVSIDKRAYIEARAAFRALWESINGPGAWAANPWVWVVEFKRVWK